MTDSEIAIALLIAALPWLAYFMQYPGPLSDYSIRPPTTVFILLASLSILAPATFIFYRLEFRTALFVAGSALICTFLALIWEMLRFEIRPPP